MNITENEINKIREIKATIKNSELSLEKFMSSDLSDKSVRNEMREILATIENMESKLSAALKAVK